MQSNSSLKFIVYMANILNSVQSNKISLDSFKLRIPSSVVKIIDTTLMGKWSLVHDETGDIDPHFNKLNSVTRKENGKTSRYAIERQVTKDKTVSEFITMLINSKLLESNYFDGITKDNIKLVYDAIIAQRVVYFTFEDFIAKSDITDMDFKKDAIISDFSTCINQLRNLARESKQKGKGYRHFNTKENKGIEFSDRRTTAYKTTPYIKLYHKELELIHKSWEFKDAYLNGIDFKNVVRIETTVKNNAHCKHLGIKDNSLNTLLNLTDQTKEQIIRTALSRHIQPRVKPSKEQNELKPMEKILYAFLIMLMDNGVSFESAKNNALNIIENKTERNRKRKQLDEIYNKHIKGSESDLKSKELSKFWDFIAW